MASTKVRGISIELSADTSGLVKSLKEANSAINNTQRELKDIDKLLKFNPNSFTLMKQRTQALQSQIGNTKTKLTELKKAEADMKSKGVDENSEQFRALQREIIATESKLKELNNTAGSGSATLYAISQTTAKIGDGATKAGKALMPVTAGVTALGTAAVKTTADFDASMSKVAAVSGATGKDFDALRDKAREMGSKTKFSASEAADALNYMAMAGWKTDEMLGGLEGIMNLAAASGSDLATTSDIVTDALTAFGMSAEDSGKFADILAAASSNANTNVEMLGESFKYVAPLAGAMGYSAEDTSIALALMANSGVKASSAGTALRSIMTRMASPTDEVASAMEVLGISLDDGQGNMKSFREVMLDLRSGFSGLKRPSNEVLKNLENLDKALEAGEITQELYEESVESLTENLFGAEGAMKAEAAAALAGKQGLSGLLAIVNASDEDFNKLTNAIDNSSGSAEDMAERMQDNLSGQLQILKSQLQELAISFGDILMPAIRNIVGKIQGLVDKFNGLDEGTKRIITAIAGIVAAVAPVLLIFGKLATAISAITRVMSTMKFASLLTNPITLAIAAVAGLVAGFKALNDALYNGNSKLSSYEGKLKELGDANDSLADSIAASKKELEDKVTASEAEAGAAESLMKKLNDLMAVEDKDAGQKEQIKALVEQLNELVPDLGLAYDGETDSLNKTNAEIQRNIDLRKQQAQADAYMSAYSDALKKAAEAEILASDAQDTLNKMYAEAGPDVQELYDYVQQYGEEAAKTSNKLTSSGRAISAVYLSQEKDLDLLMQATNEVTEAQDAYNKETARSEKLINKWQDVNDELVKTQTEVQKALNKTNLKSFREELGRTFGKDLPAELNKALNAASSAGVEIPEELQQGILDGSKSVTDACAEINKLVDSELKKSEQNATTSGGKTTSNYAEAIGAKRGLAYAAAGIVANESNKGLAANDQAKAKGGAYGTNYKDGIIAKTSNAYNAAFSLAGQANKGAAANNYGKTKGGEYGNNYKDGIIDKASKAYDAAFKLAGKSNKGASDNNYGKTKGGEFGSDYNAGIIDKVSGAYNNAASLAKEAKKGAENNNSGNSLGKDFGQGYADGIWAKIGAVTSAAVALANTAKTKVQTTQNSGSPSKIAMALGNDFGEGYSIGIEQQIKSVMSASKALVNGAMDGAADYSAFTANAGSITANGSGAVAPGGVVNNYTQNNYSPQALSVSDIYRQTNNLLSYEARYV